MRKTALILASLMTTPAFTTERLDMNQPFDSYTWVTAHNAWNMSFPANQDIDIAGQLADGVRGFMLDLHAARGRVRLCHKACLGGGMPFADLLNETLLPYLERHPDVVVTLQLEDFGSVTELSDELSRAPGLAGLTFDPSSWDTDGWPTYGEMVARGQRVVVFSLNRDNSGVIHTAAGPVHIMPSEDFTVENYWSLGLLRHDYSCTSRWLSSTLSRTWIPGKPGWRPLFTMNQFHDLPKKSHAAIDNAFDALQSRYVDYCLPAAGRAPNFVAVDYYQEGDVAAFVENLNEVKSDIGPN